MKTNIAALAALSLITVVDADVPDYGTYQLQARANFTVNGGGFNLPGDAFFANATPHLNDSAQVVVRINTIGGTDTEGVFLGQNGVGSIVYTTPVDASVSDPTINNSGFAVFEQRFSSPDGIFFYDSSDSSSGLLTDQPLGASGWSSTQVNDSGNVGYRASFLGDNAYYLFNGLAAQLYAAEVDLVAASPYSFIFTPAFNNADQIAAKVRLGSAGQFGETRPDEIRIFNTDGTSTLIAEDQDANAASLFDRFDNSVALTDDGRVAFIATLSGGVRGVFISDGASTITATTIADETHSDVADIEFFGPAVNESGHVAFRAGDGDGFQAIFVGDGTDLTVVVREHDILPSDLGDARIDQNDNSVVFGGSIRINESGQVAFNCALTPPGNNQIEYGSGIYIASPIIPCPWDCAPRGGNGTVNFDDLVAVVNAISTQDLACDVAPDNGDGTFGNGVITFDDLIAVINNFGDCP